MEILSEPAAFAAFARVIFRGVMFGIIAVILRIVPEKLRKILSYRLW